LGILSQKCTSRPSVTILTARLELLYRPFTRSTLVPDSIAMITGFIRSNFVHRPLACVEFYCGILTNLSETTLLKGS
jgi:hypothetical protein